MDRIIHYSYFGPDIFYSSYEWLNDIAINDYQLLTMIWNIILTLIPLAIYLYLKKYWRRTGFKKLSEKGLAFFWFCLWLLFFPNTAYIMTDIRHLINYCPIDSPYRVCVDNAWMIIFFFSYASFGWLSFCYLLKLMSALIKQAYNQSWSEVFIILMVPLTSLGVLLGLLNRFNSLDALFFTRQFLSAAWLYFSRFDYFVNWLIFTAFFYLLYFIGDAVFRKVKDQAKD